MKGKRSSGSGAAAAPALTANSLEVLLESKPTTEQFCTQLAKLFQVRANEVALYRLEGGQLKFVYPVELNVAGSIPLSSASAVTAHTATTKKVELFNNFVKVRHASVFEQVKLGKMASEEQLEQPPIQKLMSAPVVDGRGDVLGVLQVCRKGSDLASSGPDFSLEDLRRLESATKVLATADFMQP